MSISTAIEGGAEVVRAQVMRSQPIGPDTRYPVEDVLALSGISRSTFYRAVAAGRGPKITKMGGRTLVRGSDLKAWLDAQA